MSERLFPVYPYADTEYGSHMVKSELTNVRTRQDITIPFIGLNELRRNPDTIRTIDRDQYVIATNTLSALFLPEIVTSIDDIRRSSHPYGLHHSSAPRYTISSISNFNIDVTKGLNATMKMGTEKWSKPWENWVEQIPEDHLPDLDPEVYTFEQRMFGKFWYITAGYSRALMEGQGYGRIQTPKDFINSGPLQAASAAVKITRVNGEVYMRDEYDPEKSDAENIAAMADVDVIYPMTSWLSKMVTSHETDLRRAFMDNPSVVAEDLPQTMDQTFNTDYFKFRRNGTKRYLVPAIDVTTLQNSKGQIIFEKPVYAVRTGCPAMAAEVEDDSAENMNVIKYLLKWTSGIAADTLYPGLIDAHK